MKLSYKDRKTIVEIDGKQMSMAEAVLKYPNLVKEIAYYSITAKKLSEIKVISVTHVEASAYTNPTTREEDIIPEKWVVEVSEKGTKKIKSFSTQEEVKKTLKMLGVKNVEGTQFANGKPLTKANYDFIQSYLNSAELDLQTGKISTNVEPSFDIESLCEIKAHHPKGNGHKGISDRNGQGDCSWYSLSKGKALSITDCVYFDHYDPEWDVETSIDLIDTKEFFKKGNYVDGVTPLAEDKRTIKCFTYSRAYNERGYISKLLEKAGFEDLVDLKVSSLIEGINAQTKSADIELSK